MVACHVQRGALFLSCLVSDAIEHVRTIRASEEQAGDEHIFRQIVASSSSRPVTHSTSLISKAFLLVRSLCQGHPHQKPQLSAALAGGGRLAAPLAEPPCLASY
eukprot:2463886-Pleurochrysis_carterae.AAC.2